MIFEFSDHSIDEPLPVDGCYCQVCTAWRSAQSRRRRLQKVKARTLLANGQVRVQPSPTIGQEATLDLLLDIFGRK